jgi:hypothetical protein
MAGSCGGKDSGSRGWADFADGFGFWISHKSVECRVLGVECGGVKKNSGRRLPRVTVGYR